MPRVGWALSFSTTPADGHGAGFPGGVVRLRYAGGVLYAADLLGAVVERALDNPRIAQAGG